jgi:hypothetical protein
VTKDVTEVGCSECGWSFNIPHNSDIADLAEEQKAARSYTAHACADFPIQEINPKVS